MDSDMNRKTCQNCKHWHQLGIWWGKCANDNRTAIETKDPGAGPEMTRITFKCSVFEQKVA